MLVTPNLITGSQRVFRSVATQFESHRDRLCSIELDCHPRHWGLSLPPIELKYSPVNIIRRITCMLAMLLMILPAFAQTSMVYCLGCEDAEVTRHTCCDEKDAGRPVAAVEPLNSANATKPAATCVNCVQVVVLLQTAPTAKTVVESPSQHFSERFVPMPTPRVISLPVRRHENFNSPGRLLHTVQLLI